LTGGGYPGLHRYLQPTFASQIRPQLPVSDCPHGWKFRMKIATLAQPADLLQEALRQHLVKALRQALMQRSAVLGDERQLQGTLQRRT
jgi:hypothetical protein